MDTDDLAEDADAFLDAQDNEFPKDTGVTCPKTGEPILEFEKAFDVPGWPECAFYKVMGGRTMTAADYRAILKSGAEGVKFEGFFSKAKNKSFGAKVRYNPERMRDDEIAPGCEFVFDNTPRVEKPTGTMCPKSSKPATDGGKMFLFPGFPGLACWKSIAQREMSVEEYRDILASEDGKKFDGFTSKKTGKKFSATLKYSPDARDDKPGVVFCFD